MASSPDSAIAATVSRAQASLSLSSTWSRPTIVAWYVHEAERFTVPVAQVALRLSGLPAACSPSQPATARILDVCAGTGAVTFAALPFIAHSTCTDFSAAMLEAASERARRLGVAENVTAEVRDCTDLSAYGDGTFDAVFCIISLFLLESDEKRRQAVREMHRVVKPGGTVVVANFATADKSPFHALLTSAVVRAMQAKLPSGTAFSPAAPVAPGGQYKHNPVFPLSSEQLHSELFGAAPFASVDVSTQSLSVRTFLSPWDFWYGIKRYSVAWQWGGDDEERRADEAAMAWLTEALGGDGPFSPLTAAIVAVGRK